MLLLVQLTGMLVVPFAETSPFGHAIVAAFGTAVLIVTTGMVRRTPGLTWVSVGIAIPAIALLLAQMIFVLPQLQLWSSALEALFYFYAAGCLIAYMLADRRASTDELYAGAATFTLLAWGFVHVYLVLQIWQPGSFAAVVNAEGPRSFTELMYLSFALLSSTGIGDVIPVTPQARAVASLEMFVGVMYLAAVVSRLIGLTLLHRAESDQKPP